jgi:hypothetical protein
MNSAPRLSPGPGFAKLVLNEMRVPNINEVDGDTEPDLRVAVRPEYRYTIRAVEGNGIEAVDRKCRSGAGPWSPSVVASATPHRKADEDAPQVHRRE